MVKRSDSKLTAIKTIVGRAPPLALYICLGMASSAQATMLMVDFEEFGASTTDRNFVSPFISKDVRFQGNGSGQDYAIFGSDSVYYTGSNSLTPFFSETHVMSLASGGTFDLVSWDMAEVFNPVAYTLDVTGIYAGGGSIVQRVTTDGVLGLETFSFSGFNGLSSVSFVTSNTAPTENYNGQLDNIVLRVHAPIPTPATLGLLVLGVAGLAWRRGAGS